MRMRFANGDLFTSPSHPAHTNYSQPHAAQPVTHQSAKLIVRCSSYRALFTYAKRTPVSACFCTANQLHPVEVNFLLVVTYYTSSPDHQSRLATTYSLTVSTLATLHLLPLPFWSSSHSTIVRVQRIYRRHRTPLRRSPALIHPIPPLRILSLSISRCIIERDASCGGI